MPPRRYRDITRRHAERWEKKADSGRAQIYVTYRLFRHDATLVCHSTISRATLLRRRDAAFHAALSAADDDTRDTLPVLSPCAYASAHYAGSACHVTAAMSSFSTMMI